jgi:hypothetical protein
MRGGKRVATDGPFAETKEQLGGYYLVDAKDLHEAIAIAARIPSARTGSIEVRPLVVRETRIFGAHARLLARRRMSESGQSIPKSRNARHKTAWRIAVTRSKERA